MKATLLYSNVESHIKEIDSLYDIDFIEIDDPLATVNIAIVLKNASEFTRSERLLYKLLRKFPNFGAAHHELALVLRYQERHSHALRHALRAYELERHYIYTLAVQLCACGRCEHAKQLITNSCVQSQAYLLNNRVHHEFSEYISEYSISMAVKSLRLAAAEGRFINVEELERMLFGAIEDGRSFSIARLGDGEGAWTYISAEDEIRYGTLYNENRRSFLNDWFGDETLLYDESFLQFALRLQEDVVQNDVIGITDVDRLMHEGRLMSMRGLTTSINLLREHGFFSGMTGKSLYCSNSIHHDLHRRGSLIEAVKGRKVGLISSHQNLGDILRKQGADIRFMHLVPGDSRNFWRNAHGEIVKQWPESYAEISQEICNSDLRGTVVLVAAGFVGKQYMPLIRQQGGVAIDVGYVADILVR